MNIKTYVSVIAIIFCVYANSLQAQNPWTSLKKLEYNWQENNIYEKEHFPSEYNIYSLDLQLLNSNSLLRSRSQSQIIELPNSNGGLSKFKVKESSNLAPELALKFPNIKSYSAQGIDDPTATAKISYGTDGFHAVIFSGKEETLYIDPYTKDKKAYIVYKRSTLTNKEKDFECLVKESSQKEVSNSLSFRTPNDGLLRTYRIAIVCSGEYSSFHLTRQEVSTTASDAVKKAAVLSAMNTSMTRINGVFEKDLSVKMEIVANNDKVIFLNSATDGISDGSPGTMINEVQTIADREIGDANYDIGHIFSIGGDGLAGLGVVCLSGQKAKGVTGRNQPVGDPYDIDFVAHELGHQFGATHTQNNSCQRTNSTAVEPGSASTIMGYAGICAPNVQNQSDDHFHAVSIAQMWNIISFNGACATTTNTNNAAPVANAGADYSIPRSTPFVLRGSATDANNLASLTYNWEQIDNEIASMPPQSTNSAGPTFRSLPSKTVPNRYMPDLSTVISGTSSTWEVLPSVAREMNFSFLVRDNFSGGGGVSRDDMKVTVLNVDPFMVSIPNASATWNTGSTQRINWTVGSTDEAPINCQLVNIKLSIDGGQTFPIVLSANTPNDGIEDIIVPDNATSSARIMVEAVDNIFYNVNDTNFSIVSVTPTFILTNTSGTQSACNVNNQTVTYNLDVDFVNGFSENVTFSTTGQPNNSSVSFNPTSVNSDQTVVMTVSNLNGVTAQDYTINVVATSNSKTQNIDVGLKITGDTFSNITLSSPANNATGVSLSQELSWVLDANASSYDVQIATDNSFSTIISSGTVDTNSYTSTNLSAGTTYFWRVKPKNNCGEGNFSNPFSFTTDTPSYCDSNFTDDVGGKEHITNVTFNTINNSSGNAVSNGYEDFTSIKTNIKRKDTHQISVTFDTDGFQDHCFVFIDWNRDFVFDTNTERYDLGTHLASSGSAIGTRTLNITVPDDAKLGDTRMRIIVEYATPQGVYGEGPCDSDHLTEWGETEDYTLTIEEETASIVDTSFSGFNLYPNPTNGEFNLKLDVLNTDKLKIELFDVRGRLIEEKVFLDVQSNFSKKIFFSSASKGLYLLKVTNGNKQTTRKLIIN